MDEVPDPPVGESRGKYDGVWFQVCECKPGKAVRVEFESEKQAKYVRAAMRKKAKADGKFLSSSHTADGTTWYFWLEKPE
jgi:hypothetical protein